MSAADDEAFDLDFDDTPKDRVYRARLDALEKIVADLRVRLGELENAKGLYLPDRELDTPRSLGATVKFDPRGHIGKSFKGARFCDCPPDYLDQLASVLSDMAERPKEGKEKFAPYNRLDAQRARSYARRLRAGWRPPGATPSDRPPAAGFRPAEFRPAEFRAAPLSPLPPPPVRISK